MILINDLNAHSKSLADNINKSLARVLSSGWFVLGPEVGKFENQFAEYVGVEECVSLANGTDALELALRSLGVKANDEVATVANAGMYTTTALIAIGALPVFMDVDVKTCVTTLEECKRVIAKGVKAIVVTHLYGRAVPEIDAIAKYCAALGVPLVEDCAQAHGAKINGKMVGSFGDIACFSFYPTKNLGALGDGGAIVTNKVALAEKVKRLRQYGWAAKYEVVLSHSRNSRLDEMQAAILVDFLPLLDKWNARRREIACLYEKLINHTAIQLPSFNNEEYVAHLYIIQTKNPLGLRTHLKANDVASEVHYPIPDYKQPVFEKKFEDVYLKNTEILAASILTLPCYPELTDEQVSHIAKAVNSWAA